MALATKVWLLVLFLAVFALIQVNTCVNTNCVYNRLLERREAGLKKHSETTNARTQFAAIALRDAQGTVVYEDSAVIKPGSHHTEDTLLNKLNAHITVKVNKCLFHKVSEVFIYSDSTPCNYKARKESEIASCSLRIRRELAEAHANVNVYVGFRAWYGAAVQGENNKPEEERMEEVLEYLKKNSSPPNLRYMRIWEEGGTEVAGWVTSEGVTKVEVERREDQWTKCS